MPWSNFHWLVVIALGITWTLDGLEVTLNGAVSGVLQDPQVMNFSAPEIGSIASAYLAGAVLGSLLFGYLTDRWGRKKLFFITLAVYLLGTLLTAFSWNLLSFAVFRFITGSGIGGEYAAISSAIDELIPAAYRGRVNLIINGSYWLGRGVGRRIHAGYSRSSFFCPEARLARGIRDRRSDGPAYSAAAKARAGKPALADDARRREGRRDGHEGNRIARGTRHGPHAA